MVEKFLIHLKDVVGTPYGVIAIIFLMGMWALVTRQISRLNKIDTLPQKERSKLLKREYSTFPRASLLPEQWLRSQKYLYIFVFAMTAVILGAIVIIALKRAGTEDREKPPLIKPEAEVIITPTPAVIQQNEGSPASVTPTPVISQSPQLQTTQTSPERSKNEAPGPSPRPNPEEAKDELARLLSAIDTDLSGSTRLKEIDDISRAKEDYSDWADNVYAILERIDRQMLTAYGVKTDYAKSFDEETHSIYFGRSGEDDRRDLQTKIDERIRKLMRIRNRVRADLIRYGGYRSVER